MLTKLGNCSGFLEEPLPRMILEGADKDAVDLNLRFSRRFPTEDSRRQGFEDYLNVIYTQNKAGEAHFSVDYQQYFKPFFERQQWWSEKPFTSFAERAVGFFNDKFQAWMQQFVRKEAEVGTRA